MESKQETKSLPRNRKCGNCRYFEPAPLWRKGWCRNPRLYDRRANHLVDAATIDCEQVFRARIYWEPVPLSEMDEPVAGPGYSPFVGNNATAADNSPADGGRSRATQAPDGVLRPRAVNPNAPQSNYNDANNLPTITRRERAAAAPGIVPKASRVRRWLNENIPYYDKVDGPITRMNLPRILPWLAVLVLAIIVFVVVTGGNKNNPNSSVTPPMTATANANATIIAALTPNPTSSGTPVKGVSTPTPTLSTLVATATIAPTAAPTATPTASTAKVSGVGTSGLRMRKDPGKNGAVVTYIPENETVTITSADFKNVDGIQWWPVSYKTFTGWVDMEYLKKDQ